MLTLKPILMEFGEPICLRCLCRLCKRMTKTGLNAGRELPLQRRSCMFEAATES